MVTGCAEENGSIDRALIARPRPMKISIAPQAGGTMRRTRCQAYRLHVVPSTGRLIIGKARQKPESAKKTSTPRHPKKRTCGATARFEPSTKMQPAQW